MSQSFREMAAEIEASQPSVNMSFLEEYEARGRKPSPVPTPEPELDAEVAPEVPQSVESESAGELDEGEPEVDETAGELDAVPSDDVVDEKLDLERETPPARPEKVASSAAQTGGSGSSGASTPAEVVQDVAAAVTPPAAAATPAGTPEGEADAPRAGSGFGGQADSSKDDAKSTAHISAERKSDQRDDIQRATSSGGTGGSSTTLPRTGFQITGATTQPQIRSVPEVLIEALRSQVRQAALRTEGVDHRTAVEFSKRLSIGALVTAFLMARLDVQLETDASTRTAARLLRSQDPLLGSLLERMESLEQHELEQGKTLEATREALRAVQKTSAVLEQAMAYSIADRTENFLRGNHDIRHTPITHKDAVFLRDRIREETEKQLRIERDREGRPIR